MSPEMMHDLLVFVAYPVLTAVVNGLIALAGKSDHPAAKILAQLGTVAMSSTKAEKK